MQSIHNRICSANNLFFYVTGCFGDDDLDFLSKCIESYNLFECEIRQNIAPIPEKFFKRNGQIEMKNNNYHYIRFSFYIDNAEFNLDDAEKLNWDMAYECHIMNNSYKRIEEKKKEYQRVTPNRMMEIANEIFTQDNMIITLKTNKKAFNLDEAFAITKKL